MAETNDTFRPPEIAPTEFVGETQLDLHMASEGTAPYEPVRLARESVQRAVASSTELEQPSFTEQITQATQTVIVQRRKQIDGSLDIYDEKSTSRTSFAKRALSLLTGAETPKLFVRPTNERSLIQAESKIGAQIFGDVSSYTQREFFCLDERTWIWYESQQDTETGRQVELTTRYEVHPNGILKAQEGTHYSYLDGEELQNLAIATQLYADRVSQEIYNPLPDAA